MQLTQFDIHAKDRVPLRLDGEDNMARRLAEALEKIEHLHQENDNERRKRVEAEREADKYKKDSLTGLFVRAAMMDAIEQEQYRVNNKHSQGGIVMAIDMRFLKLINDGHGHAAGDAAIASFGKKLKSMLREGDIVARPGGDEFVVVMPDVTPQETFERRSELKAQMRSFTFMHDNKELSVGIRMGVAKYNATITIKDALKTADEREAAIRNHLKKSEKPRYS